MTAAGAEAHVALTERAPRRTLADALRGRDNALNFVRLILATMVILAHAWLLGGWARPFRFDVGEMAVNGFFAISGFLIAGSRVRLTFGAYLWRRALRIFPAYWVVLVVVAFGFAPLAVEIMGGRWEVASSGGFVVKNLGLWLFQRDIAGTIPNGGEWAGPWWTLFYEFLAYLAAGVLLSFGLVRRHAAVCLSLLLTGWILLELVLLGPLDLAQGFGYYVLRLGGFFLAGMVLWSVGDRVPVKWWLGVPALIMMFTVASMTTTFHYTLGALPTAYAVLWLGSALPVRVGSVNDISYGVYIYGWSVQVVLMLAGVPQMTGSLGYFFASLMLTLPLALGSWVLVERPALRLKSLLPG